MKSLQVHPDGHFLQWHDGAPFFYLADTGWTMLARLSREEIDFYLRDRAAKGFNVIQTMGVIEFDGLRVPNCEGHLPLENLDPATPNDAYWQLVDWAVERAAELGIVLAIVPMWGDKMYCRRGVGPEVLTPENSFAFGEKLRDLPLRADWKFVEPDEIEAIWAQCDPNRPRGVWREITPEDAAPRIEVAFLSSVCGCVLGKPLEISTDLAHIRATAEAVGAWPLNDYIPEKMLDQIGKRHGSWVNTVRENIHFVEPDDDINYSILGMLLLEAKGAHFSKADVRDLWLDHLPVGTTWGPERTMMARAANNHLMHHTEFFEAKPDDWATTWNPQNEFCGAQIRADAYGYACASNPQLAATLAHRDASFSHRKTGIYATMWTAAAIAAAPVAHNPLEIFEIAEQFVPQNSRFARAMATALDEVRASSDWLDGYERLRGHFGEFGHCQVFFESATLINTLFHAQNIGDGFCKQVMQGNDTDSYGATSSSILGMYFGPGHLESRWLEPFGDDIHTALAWFFERSLSKLAKRMSELPARLAQKSEVAQ